MLTEEALHGTCLCVVGNINRDIKTSPVAGGPGLTSDGETAVDSITETIGGGGANSAFAAAALGAKAMFLGRVGADALGARLERALTQRGIAAHLKKDALNPSGTSLALAYASGHRHFLSCLPANRALAFEDLDLSALDACDHLLRADVWFSESMLFEGNARLFEAARKRGIPVSIDLNWDPDWSRGPAGRAMISPRKAAVRQVLRLVEVVHGNVRELMEFAEAPDLATALKHITDCGAGSVVVHLGAQGSGYYKSGTLVVAPPMPAKTHVHATGTGDVLSVCMMLLHHRTDVPIDQRLRLANTIVSEFIEGKRELIPPLPA